MTPRPEEEALALSLNDDNVRAEYAAEYAAYRPGCVARFLGGLTIGTGNFLYGKTPSYAKFRALEVIARVPYHSWVSAAYTLLTLGYTDEERAIKLSGITRFARHAQDNETMHVVVISKIAHEAEHGGTLRHSVIPLFFAFLYFWTSYWLYLLSRRSALELNYLFEEHAYAQYAEFIDTHTDELRGKPVDSRFLTFYGREAKDRLEFFQLVRNDELIHRNRSLEEIVRN